MKLCVLASGSKGNMTYIENKDTRLLIDTGISLQNASKRKSEIDFSKITDILITHEHTDHIYFLETVLKKTKAHLYMSRLSFEALPYDKKKALAGNEIRFIQSNSIYKVGNLSVMTLLLSHDTVNTFGFIVCSEDKKIGYITDTGVFPDMYNYLLKDLDALVIEANHNIEMLINSDRRIDLKNRILSSKGHLSNNVCCNILKEVVTDKNKYIILAHVSEECNDDEHLKEEIINIINKYTKGKIVIARQNEASDIFVI